MSQLTEELLGNDQAELQPTDIYVDRIYACGFRDHCLNNSINMIYSVLRIVTLPIFIGIALDRNLQAWFVSLFIVSLVQLRYYMSITRLSKNHNVFYTIAERMGHFQKVKRSDVEKMPHYDPLGYRVLTTYDLEDVNYEGSNDQKVKRIAEYITRLVPHFDAAVQFTNRIQFITGHFLFIWGLIIYFSIQDSELELPVIYLTIILVFNTFQYLGFYLLVALLLLWLPFWAINELYLLAKHKIKLYKLKKVMQGKELLNVSELQGGMQCKICLQQYQLNQKIIVLNCNAQHNFHADCLQVWANNALTCPMCRRDLA